MGNILYFKKKDKKAPTEEGTTPPPAVSSTTSLPSTSSTPLSLPTEAAPLLLPLVVATTSFSSPHHEDSTTPSSSSTVPDGISGDTSSSQLSLTLRGVRATLPHPTNYLLLRDPCMTALELTFKSHEKVLTRATGDLTWVQNSCLTPGKCAVVTLCCDEVNKNMIYNRIQMKEAFRIKKLPNQSLTDTLSASNLPANTVAGVFEGMGETLRQIESPLWRKLFNIRGDFKPKLIYNLKPVVSPARRVSVIKDVLVGEHQIRCIDYMMLKDHYVPFSLSLPDLISVDCEIEHGTAWWVAAARDWIICRPPDLECLIMENAVMTCRKENKLERAGRHATRVECTLKDAQAMLAAHVGPDSVLVAHGPENEAHALKVLHPFWAMSDLGASKEGQNTMYLVKNKINYEKRKFVKYASDPVFPQYHDPSVDCKVTGRCVVHDMYSDHAAEVWMALDIRQYHLSAGYNVPVVKSVKSLMKWWETHGQQGYNVPVVGDCTSALVTTNVGDDSLSDDELESSQVVQYSPTATPVLRRSMRKRTSTEAFPQRVKNEDPLGKMRKSDLPIIFRTNTFDVRSVFHVFTKLNVSCRHVEVVADEAYQQEARDLVKDTDVHLQVTSSPSKFVKNRKPRKATRLFVMIGDCKSSGSEIIDALNHLKVEFKNVFIVLETKDSCDLLVM